MSSQQHRVSIVTPTLNPGDRLEQCLDSVAGQTYIGPIEHIVIDGGSRDGTLDRLRRRDGIAWTSEPDRGQSDAINKGFGRATGEVLTWLNADDRLEPDAVSRAVEALATDVEAGWVYGDLSIERPGNRNEIHRPPRHATLDAFRDGSPIPGVGTFFSRWALDRVGPLDVTLNLAMDLDLWVRLIDAGIPNAYVPHVQAAFVLHGGSKTAAPDLEQRYREQVQVFAKHDHLELAQRGLERWSWWVTRRKVVRSVEAGHAAAARAAARAGLAMRRTGVAKRSGLWLMAVAPRLAVRLLRWSGHWEQHGP